MFTGIVQELGTVTVVELNVAGGRLSISAPKVGRALRVDDSVAVNGVCLTIVDLRGDTFTAEVVPETLARTNLGKLERGDRVDLEPAVTMATPLGGHLVQGHVDGMATIVERRREGLQELIRFEAAPEILRYVVPKGFIALDGVSLTVVDCDERTFSIALIPHSAAMTTLGEKVAGQTVNVEVDLVAKYVERFVTDRSTPRQQLDVGSRSGPPVSSPANAKRPRQQARVAVRSAGPAQVPARRNPQRAISAEE